MAPEFKMNLNFDEIGRDLVCANPQITPSLLESVKDISLSQTYSKAGSLHPDTSAHLSSLKHLAFKN